MRRGKRGRGEREKVKCHEMFGDKKGWKVNTLLQLTFYILKTKVNKN
jgi:hypothetical protein